LQLLKARDARTWNAPGAGFSMTHRPRELTPVADYLRKQGRFQHLPPGSVCYQKDVVFLVPRAARGHTATFDAWPPIDVGLAHRRMRLVLCFICA
jgi:hypothetical protein